jgi:hypothetical protein
VDIVGRGNVEMLRFRDYILCFIEERAVAILHNSISIIILNISDYYFIFVEFMQRDGVFTLHSYFLIKKYFDSNRGNILLF